MAQIVTKFISAVTAIQSHFVVIIDIESLQNRLLKVCNVLATNATFLAFFTEDTNSTNETNKAGSMCH